MKHTRTPAFQAASGFFETIEKFLHFPFITVENFSNSEPRPPGQRKFGENPTPRQWERANPRGLPGGWSGLELTDT